MEKMDKIIEKIALPILATAAVLIIIGFIHSVKTTSRENNGYIRVINCVISIPATKRTQEDIEKCYETVESGLNIKLQRYDTSSYNK